MQQIAESYFEYHSWEMPGDSRTRPDIFTHHAANFRLLWIFLGTVYILISGLFDEVLVSVRFFGCEGGSLLWGLLCRP